MKNGGHRLNLMKANPDKFQFMVLGIDNKHLKIWISGVTVFPVSVK